MRFVSIIIILLGWIRRSFSLSVSDYSTQTTVFPLLCWLLRFIAIPVSMFVFPVALLQLFHSVSAFQACVCGVWSCVPERHHNHCSTMNNDIYKCRLCDRMYHDKEVVIDLSSEEAKKEQITSKILIALSIIVRAHTDIFGSSYD